MPAPGLNARQVVPFDERMMVPPSPTARHCPPTHATRLRLAVVPEVRRVQFRPSELVATSPDSPTPTKRFCP